MMKYHLSNRALKDIDEIWDYSRKKWSKIQARNYYKLLFKSIIQITSNPGIGKKHFYADKQYKYVSAGSHLIFYRLESEIDTVNIVRILHKSMDIKSKL